MGGKNLSNTNLSLNLQGSSEGMIKNVSYTAHTAINRNVINFSGPASYFVDNSPWLVIKAYASLITLHDNVTYTASSNVLSINSSTWDGNTGDFVGTSLGAAFREDKPNEPYDLWYLSFTYNRDCPTNHYGYLCLQACFRTYYRDICLDCNPVNGSTECCKDSDIDPETCQNMSATTAKTVTITTAQDITRSSATVITSVKNKEKLFFWLMVAFSCLCAVLLFIAVIAIITAFQCRRNLKESKKARYDSRNLHQQRQDYNPPYYMSGTMQTTQYEDERNRSSASDFDGIYSVPANLDESVESWFSGRPRREARV